MFTRDQQGSAASIAVIAVLAILLAAVSVFAFSAYSAGQDYKSNSDKKAAEAVEAAKKSQAQELQAKFDEEAKKPNLNYKGPVAYGSVSFDYPKTWSAYVDEGDDRPINGYFHPKIVPAIDSATAYALRVELVNTAYADVVEQYNSLVTAGKLKSRAYIPPKMENTANVLPGLKLEGDLGDSQAAKNGQMVIIQVRDKTLKIYAESSEFLGDFNNTILPSLIFSP